jgi:hypothetical protein
MDDNTGSYVSSSSNSPKFYVYSTSANRALRIYNDNTNYNPASPSSYSGSYVTSNNQIVLGMSGSGGGTQVNTYTITATANPTAGGTVTGAGTYDEGATVTLRATANSGYTFSKWTKNGTQVSTNATYSFTATANAAYVAVFTQQTTSYTITATANPSNGGTVSGAGNYASGATCTLVATPATGYEFTNWTKNGTQVSTNASYSFTVTGAASYVANFTEVTTPGPSGDVTIGSGSSTNAYIPTYAYYKYSLTEQIFTAAEIGQSGTITAISFKVSNSKSATRTLAVYLKHTTKTSFTSKKGWEAVSSSNLVYSGSVTFNASGWTTITLNTPFEYNGTNNLLLAVDDNTGSYVSSSSNSPKFYVYSTGANRALRVYSDNTNYNPASPSSYSGSYVTSNNQVMLTMSGSKVVVEEQPVSNENEMLVIYPNPVDRGSNFTIEVPDNMTAARIEVFNTQGACVYKGQGNGHVEMSCDKMPSGLYIVRISDGDKVLLGKVIVR